MVPSVPPPFRLIGLLIIHGFQQDEGFGRCKSAILDTAGRLYLGGSLVYIDYTVYD